PKTKMSTSSYVSANPTWKVPEKSKHRTPSQTPGCYIYRPSIARISEGDRVNGMKRSPLFVIVIQVSVPPNSSAEHSCRTCRTVLPSPWYTLLSAVATSNFSTKIVPLLMWKEHQTG